MAKVTDEDRLRRPILYPDELRARFQRAIALHRSTHQGKPESWSYEDVEAAESRFWPKLIKGSGSDCWPWTGAVSSSGYGSFAVVTTPAPINIGAHCYSWALTNRAVPPAGMVVMHSCDNPRCVNPAHLDLGTCQDNSQDAVAKDRVFRALTGDQVLEARRRASAGESFAAIARDLGVCQVTAADACKGRTWRSMPGAVASPGTNEPRLSGSQAAEIHRLYHSMSRGRGVILARRFGVSDVTIRKIALGKAWRRATTALSAGDAR